MNANKKKEVQNWITESKRKGYNQVQIEEELKKHGYSTDIINKALGKSNRRNKIIITSVILIILILGMVGYFTLYRPNTPEYQIGEANTLSQEGKKDTALEIYQKALTEYPSTRLEYLSSYHTGNIFFYKGDYEQAIPHLKRAVELNPDDTCDSNNKLGRIYLQKEDYDTALSYFFETLRINKDSKRKNCTKQTIASTDLNIGRIYLEKGNYTGALAYLEMAYELAPNSPRINYRLGEAYYLSGKYDAAKIYLKNSLRLNNTDETASAANKYLKEIKEKELA